jgi:hypothetical protein
VEKSKKKPPHKYDRKEKTTKTKRVDDLAREKS